MTYSVLLHPRGRSLESSGSPYSIIMPFMQLTCRNVLVVDDTWRIMIATVICIAIHAIC